LVVGKNDISKTKASLLPHITGSLGWLSDDRRQSATIGTPIFDVFAHDCILTMMVADDVNIQSWYDDDDE